MHCKWDPCIILFCFSWDFNGVRSSNSEGGWGSWLVDPPSKSTAGRFHQNQSAHICCGWSWAPETLLHMRHWRLGPTESVHTIQGLSWGIIGFVSLVLPYSWITWPRSTIRSVAWPAAPTAPSTIPRLFSRPAGSCMPPQPWTFRDGIPPFTGVWASCLLSARRSTTPSGSMVSLPVAAGAPPRLSVMRGYSCSTAHCRTSQEKLFLKKSKCRLFCVSVWKGICVGLFRSRREETTITGLMLVWPFMQLQLFFTLLFKFRKSDVLSEISGHACAFFLPFSLYI